MLCHSNFGNCSPQPEKAPRSFRNYEEGLKENADISDNRKVKEGKSAVVDKRNVNTKASIADFLAKVENDQRESFRKLAQAYDMLTKTVHATLDNDPQCSEKSARWITILQCEETKMERVRTYEAFVVATLPY
jgi:hypothetical protein